MHKPRTTAARVLVLDGEQRAALAVTRSLLRAGHEVHVVTQRRFAPAAWSRGAHALRIVADPIAAPAEFAQQVAAAARRLGAEIVLPVTDGSVQALLEHREEFTGLCVPIGSMEQHARGASKAVVHALALPLGLGIPGCVTVARKGDPLPVEAQFPGVVKPHRSVIGDGPGRQRVGVQLVTDSAAAAAVMAALPAAAFPVLLQPRVHGAGTGVFALRWNGTVHAWFAHRRLREKPPAGGVSVCSESIALDPTLRQACERLLEALDWQGVAMLELKQDDLKGGWRMMEINGRFWGSLQLAIDAGVDFPALLVAAARGQVPASAPAWRTGMRLRWEWGDVDHLLLRLLRSRERLQLPPGAPSRVMAILRFFVHRPGRDRLELLRWRDPMPFIAESLARLLPG